MAADGIRMAPKSLTALFNPPTSDKCQRCEDRVYQVEKVGPVNGVIFHKQCFKCTKCQQHLTMRTYFTNQIESSDKEVYCMTHVARGTHAGLDANAIGIRNALDAPKASVYNEQWRSHHKPVYTGDAIQIKQAVFAQNQFQKRQKQQYEKHHFPAYVANKKKEAIYRAQEELEKLQKVEEDRLMEAFIKQQKETEAVIKKETDEEWEVRLKELAARFDSEVGPKKSDRKMSKTSSLRYQEEKDEMQRNMTVRMKQKKEAMTMRIQKDSQEQTSEMVQKHSQQMLELLQVKQLEVKAELEQELLQKQHTGEEVEDIAEAIAELSIVPKELPPPHPPRGRKRDLYYDPSVFEELDNEVIRIAESDQSTFTDLVMQLTQFCLTDLQKARSIFRWITVKDLNTIDFAGDGETDTDTPMGLLRGIKYGTETYHTLFMRLCGFAGLGCVEVKGHSKSVGYEPGMRIREDTFQNTWNAVMIDEDWWPVQCNWGARHLVLNKDVQDRPSKSKKDDKIRYQYDEHYFLTDPDEFIQEFWAADYDWQLLDTSITLEQFEAMPFVRSVFFHYGLEFDGAIKSVFHTDNKGGAEVKIRVPPEFSKDLVFHYQLRFADRERRHETEFRGAKLERFVFHSLVEGLALFSVHVPTPAAYFLEVFANKIDDTNKIGDDPNATMAPFRLKCACKFKVVCEELVGKMHPLPNCASGEWGPSKGLRHFSLKPLTHMTGVVSLDTETEVKFYIPRPLHFLCKLRMNGVEDGVLEKYVWQRCEGDELRISVRPPQPGQYGLDIYARPEDAADNHTLAHACKYLINCTRVEEPVDIPVSKVDSSQKMSKDKWGPSSHFDSLGLRLLTHKEPTIDKNDPAPLVIEIQLTDPLKFSFHLIREPDEDYREKVVVKDTAKKVKFTLNLTKTGNYLFALYARRKKDSDANMLNIYNYMIKYKPEENTTLPRKKSKGFLFNKK